LEDAIPVDWGFEGNDHGYQGGVAFLPIQVV